MSPPFAQAIEGLTDNDVKELVAYVRKLKK